ncbi:MAG: dipicolinate synthase subunit B [Clostridia bacterium]|nr:dipicolinate synthase subunit B [Clostridia bacterium]
MKLNNINVGFGVTGSFCNFSKLDTIVGELLENGVKNIYPIVTPIVLTDENRFSKPQEIKEHLEKLTGKELIDTISKAEPIGPKDMVDIVIVAPCTGNTLAKIANGITDTPVLMAVKSHLRNNKPVVIGISTNDGLGANAENLGKLMNTKNIFFVPFGQDDPIKKPKSLVCDYTKIVDTAVEALKGIQIQPVLNK